MKKIYILLAAVLLMVMMGCSSGDSSSPPSSAKAITAFKITSPVNATGVITEATYKIAITVPYGTDVTHLVATFTTTGTSVKVNSNVQESGKTENDFTNSTTNPVIYTVTAANASTQDYQVTVTVSPRSGSLDPAFGASGMVTTTIPSGNSQALALVIQPDGKIVAAGSSCISSSNCKFALVRYNANGTLDKSGTPGIGFGTTGIVTTSVGGVKDEAFALVIQPDGPSDFKIVVAGSSFNSISNKYDFALVRYNADGNLDAGFGSGGTVTTSVGNVKDYAQALRIQPSDNKIVVAGVSFNSVSRKYNFALVRYNTDGTLDKSGTPGTGFGATGIVTTSIIGSINDFAADLVIQPFDNKIIVTGQSNNDGDLDFALVRYNTDGTLDTGFGSGGIVTTPVGSGFDYAHALVIQPSDNKIVVTGSSASGIKYNFALVRYNTDGTLDKSGTPGTGFGATGIITTPIGSGFDSAYAIGIDNDGKILAAGYSNNGSNFDFALVRYNTDGTLDTGFGSGGIVTTPVGSNDDNAFALRIQPSDGSIVVAGRSYNVSNTYYDFALVRYLPQ
ncbi:MAG TPA: hypothetical protein PLP18_09805 [Smithellaceae bacterium]|nr:hypothetical protein [Smithellaceae bacterium]